MNRYLKDQKRLLLIWLAAEFFNSLLVVGMSLFMKQMSDTAYGKHGEEEIQKLFLFGVFIAITYLALEYAWRISRAKFLRACNFSLKKKIFNQILHYDINSFQESNNGSYISLLNNDLRLMDEKYFRVLPNIYSEMNMMAVALIAMFLYNPMLAILQIFLCIPQLLLPRVFGKKASDKQKKYMDSLDAWNAEVKDIFAGFEVVKSFGIEDKIIEKYRRSIENVERNGFEMRIQQAKSISLSSVALYLSFILQTIFSVYLVFQGEITMGILLGAMQISNFIGNPAKEISTRYLEYQTVKPVISRISAMLDRNFDMNEEKSRICLDTIVPVRIENLSFSYSYEKGRQILFDLDFQFEKGKKYAIVGGSGSGKSTLIRLLMGYFDRYEGEIYYGEKLQKNVDKKSLYQHMAMIHQKVFLFDDTIRNNITMYKPYSDKEVWKAVNNAGLKDVIERMGEGLDSRIQEGGKNLSGGEQQRIAIARAFIQKIQVLLMDEGTSSLDSHTAGLIDSLLVNMEELTLICITHKVNKELLQCYDEILVLEEGRILEHGSYENLSEQRKQLLEWNAEGGKDDYRG